MDILTVNDLSYNINGKKILSNINFVIRKSNIVVVCGNSGAGKSTLLKSLVPNIVNKEHISGEIICKTNKIGYVMQDPENQFVCDKVWHEIAFGLENLGISNSEMKMKVAEISEYFGLTDILHEDVKNLSGGQKQLVNLASVMAMNPEILILDEPTSQLDPIAKTQFLDRIFKINHDLSTTIIISEHDLNEIFSRSNKILALDGGEIVAYDTPTNVCEQLKISTSFTAMPIFYKIWNSIENNDLCPCTIKETSQWLEQFKGQKQIFFEKMNIYSDEKVLKMKEVSFSYDEKVILKNVSLEINRGEHFCLLGGNGSGKTTLFKLIRKTLKQNSGKISLGDKIGYIPQDPKTLFLNETVEVELKNYKNNENYDEIIDICDISHLFAMHPYDLSGGETQKLALCKILLEKPQILLLDEPTKGVDECFKTKFAQILADLQQKGVTIFTITHDLEFASISADRCGLMFDGEVVNINKIRDFFANNDFYTTISNLISRNTFKNIIKTREIIETIGGECKEEISQNKTNFFTDEPLVKVLENKRKTDKSIGFTSIIAVLLNLSIVLFSDLDHLTSAFLILGISFVSLFLNFEKSKPKARDIALIAVFCSIAIASRTVLFMLPQFKPTVAIVILASIVLGANKGFIIGATTMFVTNMMFMQGPWTPWQMYAMGLIGFISGAFFNLWNVNRWKIAIFGFVSTLVIYGGIMNISTAIFTTNNIDFSVLLVFILAGLPMDLVHSICTALFLWIFTDVFVEKTQRIQNKYGF